MPKKPRIDLAGYYHIINRSVNRSDIFVDDSDYEMSLKMVCKTRNNAIISALKDGYTQAKIAKFIGVSRSLVCKVVKDI